MGLATPGHIAAAAAIFAQQSVRENTRIGRTPQQVMDDAMWGVFQALERAVNQFIFAWNRRQLYRQRYPVHPAHLMVFAHPSS